MDGDVTARDRGLCHAVRIQRECDPRDWKAQLEAIGDAEERAVAHEYLRGIARRQRVVLQIAERNEAIYREVVLDGRSCAAVALDYGLTRQGVTSIVRKLKAEMAAA